MLVNSFKVTLMHVNNVIYFKFKICAWNFFTCNWNVGNYFKTYFIHILSVIVIIYLGSTCLSFRYCLFFNTPDCVLKKILSINIEKKSINGYLFIYEYRVLLYCRLNAIKDCLCHGFEYYEGCSETIATTQIFLFLSDKFE